MTLKMIIITPKMIPVIPTFPPTPKITLCSVLWRFCELWPQDKSIGATATVRYQDKSSGVQEAPSAGLACRKWPMPQRQPSSLEPLCLLCHTSCVVMFHHSATSPLHNQCASVVIAMASVFWCMERNAVT